jgi:hypothetical protein
VGCLTNIPWFPEGLPSLKNMVWDYHVFQRIDSSPSGNHGILVKHPTKFCVGLPCFSKNR